MMTGTIVTIDMRILKQRDRLNSQAIIQINTLTNIYPLSGFNFETTLHLFIFQVAMMPDRAMRLLEVGNHQYHYHDHHHNHHNCHDHDHHHHHYNHDRHNHDDDEQVKKLLERMPRANHAVLKFIFQHFVRWSQPHH